MRAFPYTTRKERDAEIARVTAGKVEEMLHDDHNVGKRGDPPHLLTFDAPAPDPAPTREEIRLDELRVKIRARTADTTELAEYLELRGL